MSHDDPSAICDFCTGTNPQWMCRSKLFMIFRDGEMQYVDTDGKWALCKVCADLIEAHDKTGLIARSSAIVPGSGLSAVIFIEAFFDNYMEGSVVRDG